MSAVSASTLLLARVGKLWQHEQAGRWTAYTSILPVITRAGGRRC
jgi:hypothetical protein